MGSFTLKIRGMGERDGDGDRGVGVRTVKEVEGGEGVRTSGVGDMGEFRSGVSAVLSGHCGWDPLVVSR